MKRVLIILLLALLVPGCSCAARGDGVTLGGDDGLVIGTSLAKRDQIAQDKGNAEIDQLQARTVIEQDRAAAGIEQSAEMSKVTRPVVLAVGIGLALAVVAIGGGYALQYATPMAKQGVAALETTLEIRKVKRLEISLEIGAGNYSGHLLAEGYTKEELADLVHQNPALDGPKVLALQGRIGDRGMQLLADRGEIEDALALLPNPELTTTEDKPWPRRQQ